MIYTKLMSVTLQIDNYPARNIKEQASLATDVEAGATQVALLNNNNIEQQDFVLIGRRGSETAELQSVASVSGATLITTAALEFRHDAYEDVTALVGSQIKVYRALNINGVAPADSDFVLHETIDIDTDQLSTKYIDATGSADYWYKQTYFNSVNSSETTLDLSRAIRGGVANDYTTIEAIRHTAGFANNRNITDEYVAGFRKTAQDQVNSSLKGVYTLPFVAPINSFISRIATSLAAGYLLIDQYGSFTTSQTTNGQDKIDWAEAQLKAIRGGDVTLTDDAGNTLPQPGGGSGVPGGGLGFSGYPNDAEQGGGFKFRSDMRY